MLNILVNSFKKNSSRQFGRLSSKYLHTWDKRLLIMRSRHINCMYTVA